jgi:hypothetical protein
VRLDHLLSKEHRFLLTEATPSRAGHSGQLEEGISQLVHWLLVLGDHSQVVDFGLPATGPRARRSLFRFEGVPILWALLFGDHRSARLPGGRRARRLRVSTLEIRRSLRIA